MFVSIWEDIGRCFSFSWSRLKKTRMEEWKEEIGDQTRVDKCVKRKKEIELQPSLKATVEGSEIWAGILLEARGV